ncbi:MAG: hypothetical protein ACKO85_15955, partial [Isosphaeraceae bacterium]
FPDHTVSDRMDAATSEPDSSIMSCRACKYTFDAPSHQHLSIDSAISCVNLNGGFPENVPQLPGFRLRKRGQHECQ